MKRIIKRILLSLIGIFLWILGIISIVTSIGLMWPGISEIDDKALDILFLIWRIILSELLLAFGVASFLLGLRCVLGPKQWIIKTIDYFWARAFKIAMIFPLLAIGIGVIFKMIEFFTALF